MGQKCIVCNNDVLEGAGWLINKGGGHAWICSDECWDKYYKSEQKEAAWTSFDGIDGIGAIGG